MPWLSAHTMNSVCIGYDCKLEPKPSGSLNIVDEVPEYSHWHKVFEPTRHHYNVLRDISKRHAKRIGRSLYEIDGGGSDTLTVRNGRRTIWKAMKAAGRFDKVQGDEEVKGMIENITSSDILSSVFCSDKGREFEFNPDQVIFARINRREMDDDEARILVACILARYEGQVVITDLGFYGLEWMSRLVLEERLICSVNSLSDVSNDLRKSLLSIKDKTAKGALFEDAKILAEYAGLRPEFDRSASDYNIAIDDAMKRE